MIKEFFFFKYIHIYFIFFINKKKKEREREREKWIITMKDIYIFLFALIYSNHNKQNGKSKLDAD